MKDDSEFKEFETRAEKTAKVILALQNKGISQVEVYAEFESISDIEKSVISFSQKKKRKPHTI